MWLGSHVAVAVVEAGSHSLDLTPSLGTSICCRYGPIKTTTTKKKRERERKKKKREGKKKKKEGKGKKKKKDGEAMISLLGIYLTEIPARVQNGTFTRFLVVGKLVIIKSLK